MAFVELCHNPIEIEPMRREVQSRSFGAYVTFTGDVRDHDSGKTVTTLKYIAYESLAEKQLIALVIEAEAQWPVSCAVVHRLGNIAIGETSVAIIVGSEHRAEAFDACRWLIDSIKTSVPIWKQETYADGETVWIEGHSKVLTSNPIKGDD